MYELSDLGFGPFFEQQLRSSDDDKVKRQHGTNTVALAYEGDGAFLHGLRGAEVVSDSGCFAELRLRDGGVPQEVLREAAARVRVSRFEILEPSLHDIFVAKVGGGMEGPANGPSAPGAGWGAPT